MCFRIADISTGSNGNYYCKCNKLVSNHIGKLVLTFVLKYNVFIIPEYRNRPSSCLTFSGFIPI